MLTKLAGEAHALDAWLHENFRIYTIILGWGLVYGIVTNAGGLLADLTGDEHGSGHAFGLLVTVAFQAGLLINQLAQFHEHRQRHGRTSRARKTAVSAEEPKAE